MTEPETVAIIGAGSIGLAWSIVFARSGSTVRIYDVAAEARETAPGALMRRLEELAANALLSEQPDKIMGRISLCPDLNDAVSGASWVQECALEDLDVKRELFAELDEIAGNDAILASSTSMIPCSRWAEHLPGRHRCVVVHPGNPPYLLPVSEIAPAPFTSSTTVARVRLVLENAGMLPVLVNGEPEGFIFNRLQGALLREAYCLVRDGVATPRDIDQVVSGGLGRRWAVIGPFATAHLNTQGGIRRHAKVMGAAYERMGAERGQHDPWTDDLIELVATDLDARLPLADWSEHVVGRDEALMHLEKARRTGPGPLSSG